ncbi:hypothetical protein NYP20_27130 [Pseudomonas sp. N3-W]|uniref:hypothetical protein n=1 Tax=Pseudomonas sp. N3-W TaxID=2975049 RepID=UPI00217E4EE7|nr:hypothetical protein [Pseudomonas sp. N3-W]UWF48919.1 hypothetical protein NYP20_27130 [Pseudomonas sp. N3-W]
MPEKKAHEEFLNPKSMLTPGIAGSLTMFITNTLVNQFGVPPNYTGLLISILFGLVVFAATSTVLWQRFVLFVLNSLFIFSFALGANQVGVTASKRTDAIAQASPQAEWSLDANKGKQAYFANWLDGTVPERKQLISTVQELDTDVAKRTLEALGAQSAELSSPRTALETRAAFSRSTEQVEKISTAIRNADKPAVESRIHEG